MCCFFMSLVFLGPRFAFLVYWMLFSAKVNLALNGWLLPLLGLIFLPWTFLMYVIIWSPPGIAGWDWLWLGLALAADIATYTSGAYKRKAIPYYPESAP
jgi:hypothetical protein